MSVTCFDEGFNCWYMNLLTSEIPVTFCNEAKEKEKEKRSLSIEE